MAGLKESSFNIKFLDEKEIVIKDLEKNIKKIFVNKKINFDAVKILLINISTHFTKDKDISEYDVLEPPLGLIALQTYLNARFNEKIHGKISRKTVKKSGGKSVEK